MLNMVAADAQINVFHAKYEFLFWRPVSAIDPTSVVMDWCGAVPGYEDGNDATTGTSGLATVIADAKSPRVSERARLNHIRRLSGRDRVPPYRKRSM